MSIKLINNLTKAVIFLENLTENANSTDLFYCFDIQLPEGVDDGEYAFILYDDGYAVANGLCQIGEFLGNRKSYNNDTDKPFIVYD